MSLIEITVDEFEDLIRQRGSSYFREGAVSGASVAEDGLVTFRVVGAQPYHVQIIVNEAEISLGCSCPYFLKGSYCKHLWAAILKADQEKVFPSFGQRREFKIKPMHTVGETSRISREAPLEADWLKQIKKAQSRVQAQQRTRSETRESRSLNSRVAHFALNLATSLREGRLNIRFVVQDHLKGGSLGVMKASELSHRSIAQFPDPKDQEILWELLGRTEKSTRHAYFFEDSGIDNVWIPRDQAASLLKKISEAGRLGLIKQSSLYPARNEKLVVSPYRFSPEPWSLTLSLVRGKDSFLLSGRVSSGEKVRPVSDILGLVAGFVLFDEVIAPSNMESARAWIELFKSTAEISIDQAEVNSFLDYYYTAEDSPALELPPELEIAEVFSSEPTVRFVLQNGQGSSLNASLDLFYLGHKIALSAAAAFVFDSVHRRVIHRHLEFEAGLRAQFEALTAGGAGSPIGETGGERRVFQSELLATIEKALSLGWEVVAQERVVHSATQFKTSISSGIDWFDLHAEIKFGKLSASLPDLLRSLRSQDHFVQLSDGSVGVLPADWVKKFETIAEVGTISGEGVRLSKIQALFLNARLDGDDLIQVDKKFASLRSLVDSLKAAKSLTPSTSFRGKLRGYQKQGLAWLTALSRHEIGGVLADDMGLGKTVQILALLAGKKKSGPTLIVAPKSLVFNWMKESEKFTPQFKVLNLTGSGRRSHFKSIRDHDIILTTYQSLRIDIEELRKIDFEYFILDEAHFVKNPVAQASLACRLISAKNKISLTGTPIENSLGDLFSILAIVNPGLMTDQQSQKWSKTSDPEDLKSLARALSPFVLRRTKEEVLKDLPEKSEQVLYCELSPAERKRYDEMKAYFWNRLQGKVEAKGLARSKIEILEALLRLRQAACHQGLLDNKATEEPSSKFDLLLDRLEAVVGDGHKALIFSQFTSLLALLKKPLQERGISFEYLDGKTVDRAERVERFQADSGIKLFLLSLKAGGVGLNLTAADYVFILDPWWNPAAESQAIDRAHRIGQKNKVFAYKLIAKDTVEEKILELQKSKKTLARAILAGEASLLKNLKMEDLQTLFS